MYRFSTRHPENNHHRSFVLKPIPHSFETLAPRLRSDVMFPTKSTGDVNQEARSQVSTEWSQVLIRFKLVTSQIDSRVESVGWYVGWRGQDTAPSLPHYLYKYLVTYSPFTTHPKHTNLFKLLYHLLLPYLPRTSRNNGLHQQHQHQHLRQGRLPRQRPRCRREEVWRCRRRWLAEEQGCKWESCESCIVNPTWMGGWTMGTCGMLC